jgi:DNA polymerase-3 subunit delta'
MNSTLTPTLNQWHLLGHDWAVEMLSEHLRADMARHAYLITGPVGVGRRTLALRFIQGMNCPNRDFNGQACMQPTCRTCRQILDMQHPDLKVVRVPDGKSEILIDQVRELQSFVMLAPYEAPYKVGLLLNFEHATVQAQNALLKTLEEAPPRARLIITADSAESLLPTIVSRCEPMRLRPLPVDVLAGVMREAYHLDPEKAGLVDHLAAGRYGYAVSLCEDGAFLDRRREVLDELLPAFKASLRKRFKLVEDMLPRKGDLSRQRQVAREVLLIWQSFLRDVLITQAGASTPVMNVDYNEAIRRIASGTTIQWSERMIGECDLALERIDRYCNIRLVMETVVEGFC